VAVTSVGAVGAPVGTDVELLEDDAVDAFSDWALLEAGFDSVVVVVVPLGGVGNVVVSSEEQDIMNRINTNSNPWINFRIYSSPQRFLSS